MRSVVQVEVTRQGEQMYACVLLEHEFFGRIRGTRGKWLVGILMIRLGSSITAEKMPESKEEGLGVASQLKRERDDLPHPSTSR